MPVQLWPDPRDGLDPNDAPWNWSELGSRRHGWTAQPPTAHPGWERWYFLYEKPDGTRVKVSADRDPQTGDWFNPHFSSSQLWP
jgi:hypothetical protein